MCEITVKVDKSLQPPGLRAVFDGTIPTILCALGDLCGHVLLSHKEPAKGRVDLAATEDTEFTEKTLAETCEPNKLLAQKLGPAVGGIINTIFQTSIMMPSVFNGWTSFLRLTV